MYCKCSQKNEKGEMCGGIAFAEYDQTINGTTVGVKATCSKCGFTVRARTPDKVKEKWNEENKIVKQPAPEAKAKKPVARAKAAKTKKRYTYPSKAQVKAAIKETNGVKTKAARLLNISPGTLNRRIKAYRIEL